MDDDELFLILGKITYTFGRIDALISAIAVDIGLTKDFDEFMANQFYDDKLKKIINNLQNGKLNQDISTKFIDWSTQFNLLRKTRNHLTHSMILRNFLTNEIRFFHYTKTENKVEKKNYDYSRDELKKLSGEFVSAHNKAFEIWQEIIMEKKMIGSNK